MHISASTRTIASMTTAADVIAECACIRTRRASRSVSRHYDAVLRPLGIKVTQFILLIAVEQGGDRSTTGLAEGLGMERTTLIRNLQLLERDAMIDTEVADGRRHARLTPKGRKLLKSALPLWREAQDTFIARLGSSTWNSAKANLEIIAQTS